MAQAIWTGTVGFGLVSVPVRLYPATRKKDVRFHEIDRLTGQRVHHQRVREEPLPSEQIEWMIQPPTLALPHKGGGSDAPSRSVEDIVSSVGPPREGGTTASDEREVTREEVIKGFELSPNRYVTVDRSELQALEPERSRSIDVEQFVDAGAVDPIYFETSYYVVPSPEHQRSFGLLVEAMDRTHRMGLAWIVLRRKRHLAALRPYGRLLVLSTMLFADEVLPKDALEPSAATDLTAKEKDMAALLVNTLSGPFEPERFRDEYRERVTALIQGRAATARPAPSGPTRPAMPDLMAALRASVEEAKKKRRPERKAKTAARKKRRTA